MWQSINYNFHNWSIIFFYNFFPFHLFKNLFDWPNNPSITLTWFQIYYLLIVLVLFFFFIFHSFKSLLHRPNTPSITSTRFHNRSIIFFFFPFHPFKSLYLGPAIHRLYQLNFTVGPLFLLIIFLFSFPFHRNRFTLFINYIILHRLE